MLVLGLQGSPRKKGNTRYLLTRFLESCETRGAQTRMLDVPEMEIQPCRELIVCEKKGFCPIPDEMRSIGYPLLRQADIVILATPVFFYNTTAQLKAFIDRSQTLWARKYRLHQEDPKRRYRRGYLLAVGATKGKNLFDGLELTAKYFFDAIGASYEGRLAYRQVEHPGDMEAHPTVTFDIETAVTGLMQPFVHQKRVLFIGREDRCRTQIATALAQIMKGPAIDAWCAGTHPAFAIDPIMTTVMAENGIDMAFRTPQSLASLPTDWQPDLIVTFDEAAPRLALKSAPTVFWDLPQFIETSLATGRALRDQIQEKLIALFDNHLLLK
jgi:arsenate reductase